MNITSIKALIVREFIEHRGMIITAPLVISALFVVLTAIGTFQAVTSAPWNNNNSEFKYEHNDGSSFKFNSNSDFNFNIKEGWEDNSNAKNEDNSSSKPIGAISILVFAAGFGMLMSLFYFSQALHSDRADKSILFWRSLPVSEWETIASKLLTGMILIPLSFVVFAIIAAVLCFIVVVIGESILGFSGVITDIVVAFGFSNLSKLIQVIFGLFIFQLSLIPVYSFILLCSAFSKRNPLLFVILIPAVLFFAEAILLRSSGLFASVKGFIKSLADNGKAFAQLQIGEIDWVTYILSAVIATALLTAAHWLRNHRYEI